MNFAYLLLHQLNIKFIENISSITTSYVNQYKKIEEIKQRNKTAKVEFGLLRKASEK